MSDIIRVARVVGAEGGSGPVAAGVGYSGPGDLESGALLFGGLRAYSQATAGSNAVRLRRDGLSPGEQDFTTLANGSLDVAAIAAFKGADNLFVRTLYDQTGQGRHFEQSNSTLQPKLLLAQLGAYPVMDFDGTQFLQWTSNITQAQPVSAIAVSKYTAFAGGSGFGAIISSRTSNDAGIWWSAAGGASLEVFYDSPSLLLNLADGGPAINTWGALQWAVNGASSVVDANGSSKSGATGTANPLGSGLILWMGRDDTSTQNELIGQINEFGYWPLAFSAGEIAALNANQRSYWGF